VPLRLGLVPVLLDDGEAPLGCAALRELRGVPLVRRALGSLLRSGAVDGVAVAAPSALVPAVSAALEPASGGEVRVLAAGDGVDPVLAALEAAADASVVLLHDPLEPLAPAALAASVARALEAEGERAAAAVPVGPVIDTLKWVGERDLVTATADRRRFRQVGSPQAYRTGRLLDALRAAPQPRSPGRGPEALPLLVQRRGGRVIGVPSPIAARITCAADLVLAGAMLDAGAATDEEAPASA
jgi:2-C-methyl-D-erythritol 4-phosphate cytidylyltransferase